jgi:hypothetical protein
MPALERAASSAADPSQWSVVWPTPAVVALGLAATALGLGLAGSETAFVLVVLLTLALVVSPLLARAEVRRLQCIGPLRLTLDAGRMRLVALTCRGRARDVLVRVGAHERLARAPWAAVVPDPVGTATALAEVRVNRRGRLPALALEVASTFPFGLCEVRERRPLACETIVRPRPLALGPWVRAALVAEVGQASGATRDPAGDFEALVEWRPGEPLRRLHMGASLRRGRLVRIEATSAGAGTVTVALATATGANAAAFERSVSAATRVVLALEHSGRRLVLRTLDGEERDGATRAAAGMALGARAALDALAVVARAPRSRPLAELVGDLGHTKRGSGPTVVVVALPSAEAERPPGCVTPGVVVIACEASGPPQVLGRALGRRRAAAKGGATGSFRGRLGHLPIGRLARMGRGAALVSDLLGGARPR